MTNYLADCNGKEGRGPSSKGARLGATRIAGVRHDGGRQRVL